MPTPSVEQVSSIRTALDKYWPSYDGSDTDFWTHEYEKHGTCAAQLAPLATELDFFSVALRLVEKYNPVPMLAAAGITPGSSTLQVPLLGSEQSPAALPYGFAVGSAAACGHSL